MLGGVVGVVLLLFWVVWLLSGGPLDVVLGFLPRTWRMKVNEKLGRPHAPGDEVKK